MNEIEKQLLRMFILSIYESGNGVDDVITFIQKTKANQKQQVVDWLNARKATNTATIAQLDAQKAAAETRLTTENTNIDSLITKL